MSLSGDIGVIPIAKAEISNNTNGIRLEDTSAASPKIRLTSSLVHHNSNYGILYNAPNASGMELLQNTFADNAVINLVVQELVGSDKL